MRALKMMVAALALQGAVAAIAQPTQLFHPTTSSWRYLADGSDQGTAWRETLFDDSTWPQGTGLFGNESNYPYPMGTTIPGATPIAVYYRSHFNWSGSTAGVVLTGTNYVDDGSIIYLNGVEIARFNMPAGEVDYVALAPAANPGGFPNVNGGEPVLVQLQIPLGSLTNGNANPLIAGDNVIAVQVHQNSATSSDRVFGLALYGSQEIAPCTDNIAPTNRAVTVGRSTTFNVVEQCAVPAATIQWFRDIGFGEELIDGATGASYTIAAVTEADAGRYYARLSNSKGVTDSRQAELVVNLDNQAPRLLSARVTSPTQILVELDEPLCIDATTCGYDSLFFFNWVVSNGADTNDQYGALITLNGTTLTFDLDRAIDPSQSYFITVADDGAGGSAVADLYGNTIPPETSIKTFPTISFQQGNANGYAGTQDAEIHSNASADSPLGTLAQMGVDLDDAGIAQSLIRFDNIFGPNPGQIPGGVTIRRATLTLNQIDPGSAINLHRMLVSWGDQSTVTWNTMVDGVVADDTEAASAIIGTKDAGVANGLINFDVTESLVAWAAGAANNGWVLLSTGTDGWDVNTAESGSAPILSVEFEVTPCVGAPQIVTQPPTATSVNEKATLNVSVGVANACESTFTWLKGALPGTPVAGQNSSTLSIANATPADAGTYRLQVTNPNGTVTSDAVTVTVVADTTRPTLTRAVGSSETQIVLTFSEALGAGADSTSHYTVSGATVTAAVVANNVVTLTTSARSAGSSTLSISGLTDTASTPNLINPNPTTVALTTVGVAAGAAYDSTWSYNTNNLDGVADWATTGGEGWLDGTGLFGTETSAGLVFPAPIATVIPPPNPNNEFLTSYYRKTVTLPALAAGFSYALSYIVDDGAVFYVDGVEIARYNMPAGDVTYSTLAPAAGAEGQLFALPLAITSGTHTIAVTVHQSANTSSDIVFGAEVIIVPTASPAVSVTHTGGNAVVTWNADASWELVSSANANGPWAAVAGNPFRTFTTPSTQAAQFYQLRLRPQP